MLQTNLLDKSVKMGRICAVYQHGDTLRLALILEDGKMKDCVRSKVYRSCTNEGIMLQTNLLDKSVKYVPEDKMGRICAVYQHGDTLRLALILEDGKMKDCVPMLDCQFVNERIYCVVIFWTPDKKILTIKLIREYQGTGLKEAKEYVEAHPGNVILKDKITYEEANEIKRQISYQIECDVRRTAF